VKEFFVYIKKVAIFLICIAGLKNHEIQQYLTQHFFFLEKRKPVLKEKRICISEKKTTRLSHEDGTGRWMPVRFASSILQRHIFLWKSV
jgi:hypothetical protein